MIILCHTKAVCTLSIADETVHTSEYVLLPNDGSGLCHTANFQWNKHVDVHFVVTCKASHTPKKLCSFQSAFVSISIYAVKNLRLWAIHLIHNFEYVSK